MTAEKLHGAIGLLPADLIAEADRRRQGRPKVIRWKRYAAMAACFALVLSCTWFASLALMSGGSSAPESMKQTAEPAAAAPMEPAVREEAAAEEAPDSIVSGSSNAVEDTESAAYASGLTGYSIETPVKPGSACFASTERVMLVTSREELESYLTDKDWLYDFTEVREVCEAFDGAWFEDHDLLLLTVHGAYPDVPYAVTSIEDTGGSDPKGWDWYVFYTTATENHPEGETTCFHLLTELAKGQIAPEDSILPIADPMG